MVIGLPCRGGWEGACVVCDPAKNNHYADLLADPYRGQSPLTIRAFRLGDNDLRAFASQGFDGDVQGALPTRLTRLRLRALLWKEAVLSLPSGARCCMSMSFLSLRESSRNSRRFRCR